MEYGLLMNDIFNTYKFNRIVYEEFSNDKLINLYLFNNNFNCLENTVEVCKYSQDQAKLYKDGKLVKTLTNLKLKDPKIISKYQLDLNQLNDTRYIRTIFKWDGFYVTLTEAMRFLNNEIELGEIQDRFQEISEAKTQEELIKIAEDCGTANYIKI